MALDLPSIGPLEAAMLSQCDAAWRFADDVRHDYEQRQRAYKAALYLESEALRLNRRQRSLAERKA